MRPPHAFASPDPPFALFDWDNTLHDGWTLEGWVVHLVTLGILNRDREPEWRDLRHRYDTGRIGHDRLALEANRAYAMVMAGKPAAEMASEAQAFVAGTDRFCVFPWVAGLLGRLAAAGLRPMVVTGAPGVVIDAHLRVMGLGPGTVESYAMALAVGPDGTYTGRLRRNPGTGQAKRRLVSRLAAPVAVAGGDSVSDLPLLRTAGRALAVGPGGPDLLRHLRPGAAWLPDPVTATTDGVYRLITGT